MRVYNFFASGPKLIIFFVERGRNRSWSLAFPILDISVRSGDIRDRSLKLSKISTEFTRLMFHVCPPKISSAHAV